MQKLKVNTPKLKVISNGSIAVVLLDEEPQEHLLSAFQAMSNIESMLAVTESGKHVLILVKNPTIEKYQKAMDLAMQFNGT